MVACYGAGAAPPPLDDSSCTRQTVYQVDPQGRLQWLRIMVTINDLDAATAQPMAIYSGALASREIWWNGERIGAEGSIGASREEERPGNLDAVPWVPPSLIRQGENVLALRLSSFHNPVHVIMPVHYVYVQPLMASSRSQLRDYAPALATSGALMAAALYFGFAFASNRRDLGSLFITLMPVFAIGQLSLESLRGLMDIPYPMQVWRLTGVALMALGFSLSMTAFVARRFAPARWRLHVGLAAVLVILAAPFAPGFDGITLFALMLPAMVSVAAVLQGMRARKRGAFIALAALAIFLVLLLAQPQLFLDRTFYLAVSALTLVFFIDQARTLRRTREAEARSSRRAALLELELLRRRIAPHFLMNTLNALAEWVESDPKTGVKMIEALAGEFRLLSQISDQALIPLGDELALCRRHLEVMSFRVDRAFTLKAEGLDQAMAVPPGVLHTLIENAFTHGRFADGAEFELTHEETEETARLVLDCPPADTERIGKDGGGEGLSYVRGRMEAAYGTTAQVESGPREGGWRTVLVIPKQHAAAA